MAPTPAAKGSGSQVDPLFLVDEAMDVDEENEGGDKVHKSARVSALLH
jgi:hypothetical protein